MSAIIISLLVGALAGAFVVYFRLSAQLHAAQQEGERYKSSATIYEGKIKDLEQEKAATWAENKRLISENATLSTSLNDLQRQMQEENAEREQRLQEQMHLMQSHIKEVTHTMMQEARERLQKDNASSMQTITHPLEKALKDMNEQIVNNLKENESNKGMLKEQLRQLLEVNQEMGNKAADLAEALRGNNKLQGNWGEMILENLLMAEGYREGQDYHLQTYLRDSRGTRLQHEEKNHMLQPDAILHYPKEQDVIIDAKTSLKSFMEYREAQTPEDKERALAAHIKSVRDHVKELAAKNYPRYVVAPRQAIEFVIMFVPNESALQLALTNDKTLWQDAFDKKVLIAGELNLRAVLRIIRIIWRQNMQVENQQKVFTTAEKLLQYVGEFMQRYEKIGKNLNTLQNSYKEAYTKLGGKRNSIIGLSNELKACGIKEDAKNGIPSLTPELMGTDEEEEKEDA